MPTTAKVVVGVASMFAVWLTLAITLFSGTGPAVPRPGVHPNVVNTTSTTVPRDVSAQNPLGDGRPG